MRTRRPALPKKDLQIQVSLRGRVVFPKHQRNSRVSVCAFPPIHSRELGVEVKAARLQPLYLPPRKAERRGEAADHPFQENGSGVRRGRREVGDVNVPPARFRSREGGRMESEVEGAYPESRRGFGVVLGTKPPAGVVERSRGVGPRVARGEDEADGLLCGRGTEEDGDDEAGYLEDGDMGVNCVRRDSEGRDLDEGGYGNGATSIIWLEFRA